MTPDPRALFAAAFPEGRHPDQLTPFASDALRAYMIGDPVTLDQSLIIQELIEEGMTFHAITEEDVA